MTTKKILVPVDFEDQSLNNLRWADFLAKKANANIILTHIIEENNFLKKFFQQEQINTKIRNIAKENIEKIIDEYLPDYQVSYSIEEGKPYEIIEDLADEFDPFLIILGQNGSIKKRKYLGSNTLHIITESDYPVVTIYGDNKQSDAENIILMPVDLTKSFNEQLTATIELASVFHSRVKVLNVDNGLNVATKAEHLVKMNKIKQIFEERNLEVETEIVENKTGRSIAEIINEQADTLQPLMVVIMLRDERNFKEFFIGNVAIETIVNCNAPVLSIRPWDEENEENPIFKIIINPFRIL